MMAPFICVGASQCLCFLKETVNSFERKQQRTVERVPVPQVLKETVDPKERVQRQTDECWEDFPVPSILEEMVEKVNTVSQMQFFGDAR